jgi:hypothetical protein
VVSPFYLYLKFFVYLCPARSVTHIKEKSY